MKLENMLPDIIFPVTNIGLREAQNNNNNKSLSKSLIRHLKTVILNKVRNQTQRTQLKLSATCLGPAAWRGHVFPGGCPFWSPNGLTSHLCLLPSLIRMVHASIVLGLLSTYSIMILADGSYLRKARLVHRNFPLLVTL